MVFLAGAMLIWSLFCTTGSGALHWSSPLMPAMGATTVQPVGMKRAPDRGNFQDNRGMKRQRTGGRPVVVNEIQGSNFQISSCSGPWRLPTRPKLV